MRKALTISSLISYVLHIAFLTGFMIAWHHQDTQLLISTGFLSTICLLWMIRLDSEKDKQKER